MSTKIYGGLILDFKGSFYELRNDLIKFAKGDLLTLAKKEYTALMAELLVAKVDMDTYKNKNNPEFKHQPLKSYFYDVNQEIMNRVKEVAKTNHRDPDVDFEFKLVVFPLKDKVLAIPYCEKQSFVKLLNELPYVKEYGYWNNTDSLENVSKKAWKQREKDWDDAIITDIPSESGFTIDLVRSRFDVYPSYEEVLAVLPSLEKRAKSLVHDDVWKEIEPTLTDEEKEGLKKGRLSIYMQKTREFATSEYGIKRTEEITKEIVELISKYDFVIDEE